MATGIGEALREAREERGLSLDDAADQTRIRATHLAALEREEYERLGGDVYVRGFIRSYARAVGIDPEQLLADHAIPASPGPVEKPPTPLRNENLGPTPRRGLSVLAAAAAVVAIVGLAVWGGGSDDRVDMDDDPFAGTETGQEPADDGGETGEPTGPTPQPSPTPSDPSPSDAGDTDDADDDDPDEEPGTSAGQDRVTLEVVDREVWARALVDGEEAWQELLSPGAIKRLDDAGEIRLRLGDAGAVDLSVDGRSLGAPGSDGEPVWVTISPDNEVSVR